MAQIKTLHREKQYDITEHEKGGWIVTRLDTGSTCKVSTAMVNKTRARLLEGEEIPFRSISYTVAIETAVIAIVQTIASDELPNPLYDLIIDKKTKTYRASY